MCSLDGVKRNQGSLTLNLLDDYTCRSICHTLFSYTSSFIWLFSFILFIIYPNTLFPGIPYEYLE